MPDWTWTVSESNVTKLLSGGSTAGITLVVNVITLNLFIVINKSSPNQIKKKNPLKRKSFEVELFCNEGIVITQRIHK